MSATPSDNRCDSCGDKLPDEVIFCAACEKAISQYAADEGMDFYAAATLLNAHRRIASACSKINDARRSRDHSDTDYHGKERPLDV